MTHKDEALKLALEAFKEIASETYDPWTNGAKAQRIATVTLTVIEQALAAPTVEEPVAWMYPDDYERMTNSETFCTVYSVEVGSATRGESTVALYTTPPAAQRQWVGLTDAEVMQTMSGDWTSQFYFARAIEAKLKEKNT
jgi:hypothetical protein